jgi:hypothetical protein
MSTLRLNVWSGPRNISTALMYSFAQRADTRVVDEPLYGHYLRVSGAPHPGADEVMAAMETDGQRVVSEVILGPCDQPLLFLKQMAHHLTNVSWTFLSKTTNVLLVRDPVQMLPSLAQNLAEPTLRDTGLALQTKIHRYLCERGEPPVVLDAKQLLLNPQQVLSQLCLRLGIDFDETMLRWPAGARPEDGVWAKYWYDNVHRSTSFEPYREKNEPFPPRLLPLLDECRSHYELLAQMAIRADKQE